MIFKGVDMKKRKTRKQLIDEMDKIFSNIIKLCDNPCYSKRDIRQVANNACSLLYLEQKAT